MASSISIKYKWFLDISIWPIDEILTGFITPAQSRSGSNGKEGVRHIPWSQELEPHQPISYPGLHFLGWRFSQGIQSAYTNLRPVG